MTASADSPLFANAAPKPSRAKTSQRSSQVTASSSTVKICGILCGIQRHLNKLRCSRPGFDRRQQHPKLRARFNFIAANLSAMLENNLTCNRETQTAAGLLGSPHRLKQMCLCVVGNAGSRIDKSDFDQLRLGKVGSNKLHLTTFGHCFETVVHKIEKHLMQTLGVS